MFFIFYLFSILAILIVIISYFTNISHTFKNQHVQTRLETFEDLLLC